MALCPPSAAARPQHRISIRLPSAAAAEEVQQRAGGLLRVGAGDRDDSSLVIGEVDGEEVRSGGHLRNLTWFRRGREVLVSWTELNDWATLPGRVEHFDIDQLSIACEWPPTREQRREFRRFALDLQVWISRGVHHPGLHQGRTRDVSGGGVAAIVPDHGCAEGERVLAVVRAGQRDVPAAAQVQWTRPSSGMIGLEFELISPSDQDHLVRLVARAENGWGR